MKEQALKIASLMGESKFKASEGWLQNFNKRHNISLQKNNGEAGLVNMESARNYQQNILPALMSGYEPENIFNADETALFFRAMPNRSYQYKDCKNDDIKVCKERSSTNRHGNRTLI